MAIKKTAAEKKFDAAIRLLEKHGYTVTPPPGPVLIDDSEIKRQKLKVRSQKLVEMMMPFKNQYTSQELNEFYLYWTEPNFSLTKMRWEMQKTWDVARRLATWHKNTLKRKSNGRQQITDADRQNKLADILTGEC